MPTMNSLSDKIYLVKSLLFRLYSQCKKKFEILNIVKFHFVYRAVNKYVAIYSVCNDKVNS